LSSLQLPQPVQTTSGVGRPKFGSEVIATTVCAAARPLYILLAAPSLLYLAALVIMLLRPPGVDFYHVDRIAFALLIFAVCLRALLLRQTLPWYGPISWAMFGLLILALAGTLSQPFDMLTWNVLSAKFLVPFILFHLAGLVFTEEDSCRGFEVFCLVTLAYLSFLAIAFLMGANALIFPRYILDESLGTHIHRARGPFLQAVANGVTLNLLGLFALHAFDRGRLPKPVALVLLGALPFAILATMTRAVWLSFAGSILLAFFILGSARMRRASGSVLVIGIAGVMIAFLSSPLRTALQDRFEAIGPVEIRIAVYRASWQMVQEKPWLGWGQNHMATEMGDRLPDYKLDTFAAHNTYLEILVEHGLVGLALYASIIVALLRLGSRKRKSYLRADGVFNAQFRTLWPILLGVYLVNACFVVMNYQFVNALLFTMAGIFCAQDRQVSELNR